MKTAAKEAVVVGLSVLLGCAVMVPFALYYKGVPVQKNQQAEDEANALMQQWLIYETLYGK